MGKANSTVVNAINKKYGSGKCIIARASDALEVLKIRKWETNILCIDLLLEGGLPKSSIVEFWGGESSLKTTTALICASKFTKKKEKVAIIDLEASFDPEWATSLGLDLDYVDICKPTTLDVGADILEALTLSGDYKLIIFDSIAAGITSAEKEKAAGEATIAKTAQIMTPTMGKLLSALQPEDLTDVTTINETTVLLLNQMRKAVGVMYGDPSEQKGGYAIKHACMAIIKFHPSKWIEHKKETIGRIYKITATKSKISTPHKTATFNFFFNPPKVDNTETLIVYGCQLGVIKQSGPCYSFDKIENAKGKVEFLKQLKEDKTLIRKLKDALFTSAPDMEKELEEESVEKEDE